MKLPSARIAHRIILFTALAAFGNALTARTVDFDLQAAIDSVATVAGGGEVRIKKGEHVIGSTVLRSNVVLYQIFYLGSSKKVICQSSEKFIILYR